MVAFVRLGGAPHKIRFGGATHCMYIHILGRCPKNLTTTNAASIPTIYICRMVDMHARCEGGPPVLAAAATYVHDRRIGGCACEPKVIILMVASRILQCCHCRVSISPEPPGSIFESPGPPGSIFEVSRAARIDFRCLQCRHYLYSSSTRQPVSIFEVFTAAKVYFRGVQSRQGRFSKSPEQPGSIFEVSSAAIIDFRCLQFRYCRFSSATMPP